MAGPWNAWLPEFIGPLWTNRNEVIILLTRVARNLHGWMDDQIEFLVRGVVVWIFLEVRKK